MHSFSLKISGTVALLAVLLAGAAIAGDECVGVEIRSAGWIFGDGFESGDLSAWGAPEVRFQATQILDLDLEVRLGAGLSGNHVLHVKLTTPRGHHYQTLTVPIAADAAQAGTFRRVESYPRPLAVSVPVAATDGRAGETAVVLRLPVAGTSIVSSGLYGTWTASAYLDNATEPCGPDRAFVINP